MKLYTKNSGSNYLAQIVTLPKPEKHPNADKLQIARINGSQIIVGLDAKEGDAYILFPLEAAINKKFLSFTNSFSDPLLNGPCMPGPLTKKPKTSLKEVPTNSQYSSDAKT